MSAGFLYVLINASMPDVIKIGKTERDPESRARELSGVTGVPTPFVVVYQEFFDDCSAAEEYVHALLEQRGCRVATNREFFSAPTRVAIQAVIQAKAALGGSRDGEQSLAAAAPSESPPTRQSEPWEDILMKAEDLHFGIDGVVQDLGEAARLYQQAAELGSAGACKGLGMLYLSSDFPGADERTGITWLNEGAWRGNPSSYAQLATYYLMHDNAENARESWAQFRKACAGCEDDSFWRECFGYLLIADAAKVDLADMDWFERHAQQIIISHLNYWDKLPGGPNDSERAHMARVRRILHCEGDIRRPTESPAIPQSEPWEGILAQASDVHYGSGDTLQDLEEAARLYQQAARLGSAEACLRLAQLYLDEDFPDANDDVAIKWLKEGGRRGDAVCYGRLAQVYLKRGHPENAAKCWKRFREGSEGREDSEFWGECFDYLLTVADKKTNTGDFDWLKQRGDQIIRWGEELLEGLRNRGARTDFHEANLCLVRYLVHPEAPVLRSKGFVKWWNDEKGYGFITGEDGQDAFLHANQIVEGKLPPIEGEPADFVLVQGEKGPIACISRLLYCKGDSRRPTEATGSPLPDPWEDILRQAEALHFGIGGTMQDLGEAARLYQQAAKLGSAGACMGLGLLHLSSDFQGANDHEAATWLLEGGRRGYAACYGRLARFYLEHGHAKDAGTCWKRFRAGAAGQEDEEFWLECYQYVLTAARMKVSIEDMDWLKEHAAQIIATHLDFWEAQPEGSNVDAVADSYLVGYKLQSGVTLVRSRGVIEWWDGREECGSIRGEDGQDVSLLAKYIVVGNLPPVEGQACDFVPVKHGKHRVASVVRLL